MLSQPEELFSNIKAYFHSYHLSWMLMKNQLLFPQICLRLIITPIWLVAVITLFGYYLNE